MSNQEIEAEKVKGSSNFSAIFAGILVPIALAIGIAVYKFILGDTKNFEGGNPLGHPIPGNYLGMMYKGGPLVPILMALMFIVLAVIVERFFTISAAKGKGNIPAFVRRIKNLLDQRDLSGATAECDAQRGSVANVIREGLHKYAEVEKMPGMAKETKVLAIQQEIEEATALELPTLERNLIILATISSIATLMGLLGTVFGMIRAFSAIATSGAPDAVALSTGISEALINTALGISTSAIAIVAYNYFTVRIDKLTYGIDEAGYSVAQNFNANH
jgi:biopolymer transport protein ExbB